MFELTQKMATTMLTPWPEGGAQCFHMDKLNPGQFSHTGQNEGFEGLLTMNWKTGNGLVMMANSNQGEYLWDVLQRSVEREYGWNYEYSGPPQTLFLIARVRGAQVALDHYTELKHSLGDWARPRNMYGQGGMVEGNDRYHAPSCACAVHK